MRKTPKTVLIREAGKYAAEIIYGEPSEGKIKQVSKVVARIHRLFERLPVKQEQEGLFPKHFKTGYGNYRIMIKFLEECNVIQRLRGSGKQTEYTILMNPEEMDFMLAAKIYVEINYYNQQKKDKLYNNSSFTI